MTDTLTTPLPSSTARVLASELRAGDHLDQRTFHARYSRTPPGFKAELIGGMVIVPSPVGTPHSSYHWLVVGWLNQYEQQTPGVRGHDGPTVILGEDSEPEPDVVLLIEPRCGGRTQSKTLTPDGEEYIAGPPELVVEVASSSVAYDLHSKKRDYEKYGVLEYLVVEVREKAVKWFRREHGGFVEMEQTQDCTLRSRVFPGLWLHVAALAELDYRQLLETLRRGIASPEHASFIQRLEYSVGTPVQ